MRSIWILHVKNSAQGLKHRKIRQTDRQIEIQIEIYLQLEVCTSYSPSPIFFLPPPPSPLATTCLFSVSINLFPFCYVYSFVLFLKFPILDSTHFFIPTISNKGFNYNMDYIVNYLEKIIQYILFTEKNTHGTNPNALF